jgi:copper chaperone
MYELQVKGMSCNHCVSNVTQSVKQVDATARVEVDLANQQVRVDSSAPLDDIASALDEAGYPVQNSKAS